ncbi:phasin family protein [Sphingomonas endophytica]|uniref:Phasin domain-containing protein n=1 Tax=Sphingomonas endophytica TaxID=869719 RepID=A0A147I5Q8_9SPHN|nr:phasin family protein [Sphingomonas endophytica]KTT74086.1 hypothetical protein NS334_05840 [Sphingomonas endophytica]
MVDQTGKGESKKAGGNAVRRPRGAAKVAAPLATPPALPEVAPDIAVPPMLANPAPDAPTPVAKPVAAPASEPVVAPEPVAAAPVSAPEPAPAVAPVADVDLRPAAPAASVEVKEVTMNETVTSFAEKAQEQTKTAFANVGEQTRVAVEKSRKVAEDLADFGKGNVEALVESARIAAQGFETLGQDAATFARARYDSTAAMFQTLASVKSPTELVQIQADYVRAAFDAIVKEASRSTEASLKLAGDVAKPLQNRVAVAADKFRTAA